ncbi:LPS-assembly lipoprotein [Noviherbaspirillum suwonense]|uniref:LPS-assembly lipoprotein LptE n=2 Tax=Noviherbaspirillum suwonense TaxID=1224511 RepID=A0ABY1PS26_9BURK|nr:LPS-assembly lipoprotein [Noviherbaspirillum suwonense]
MENRMKHYVRLLSVALAAMLALSACGFKLRGTGPQPILPFKTLFVSVAETSPLGVQLRRNLDVMSNIEIVSDRKLADAALEVLNEGRDKQVLSLNSQGRVREYTLLYRVNFRVVDKEGRQLLAPTDLVIRRIQSFNENQVLAKEAEEATLFREMQSDLVQQVLRRVSAIKPVQ